MMAARPGRVPTRQMPTTRRVLLLGKGDLTEETCEALRAAGADVTRLEDPSAEELREALAAGADAVAVVSRDDAWPLRAALLVRHLDADVPIVATIFDPAAGAELEQEIGNCTITSLADIVAPTLAGPCLDDDLAAVIDGEGLRCRDGEFERVELPEDRRAPRARLRPRRDQAVRPQRRARLLRRGRPRADPHLRDDRRRASCSTRRWSTRSTARSRRS